MKQIEDNTKDLISQIVRYTDIHTQGPDYSDNT
jgi:hypothetical protein